MYPQRELDRLARYKSVLRLSIALRRTQCGLAETRVARPFAWLDRLIDVGRRLGPLARFSTVPLSLLTARVIFPRAKILGTLARWGPLAFGAIRGLRAVFSPGSAPSK